MLKKEFGENSEWRLNNLRSFLKVNIIRKIKEKTMLYTDYQTTFTTAFVEFNRRLNNSRMAFIDFEILKDEEILKDFLLETFALRRIYEKDFESDIHTDFLQPKVEIIYNFIQDNIEDIRNFKPSVWNEISRLQEQMYYYISNVENLITK